MKAFDKGWVSGGGSGGSGGTHGSGNGSTVVGIGQDIHLGLSIGSIRVDQQESGPVCAVVPARVRGATARCVVLPAVFTTFFEIELI